MIRVLPWHDVPQPVRRIGFGVAAAAALLVVVALTVLLLVALVLRLAERGGL